MPDHTLELEMVVATTEEPVQKAQALQVLVEYLTDADPKRALEAAKSLGQTAQVLSDTPLYINSLLNAAWAAHNMADYANSLTQALEALKLARQHELQNLEYDALNIVGTNHQVVGKRPEALQAFMQARALAEASGSAIKVASVHNNIGLVYEGMEDYTSALSYYQQALYAYRGSSKQAVSHSIAAANVAESHNHLGQYEQALDVATEAATIAAQVGFSMGEGLALMHKGNAYAGLGQIDDANRCFAHAEAALHKAQAPYQNATLLKSRANLERQRGDKRKSIETLRCALAEFEALEAYPAIFPLHKLLAQAYAGEGDYQQAFHHMERFHDVKERVFNEQADIREKTLQAMYEVDKARLEAESQRHRNLALQEEIAQNEAMIDELDSYADNVAHDLKNPISLVISFADLIQSDPDNVLSETSQVCMQNLNEAAIKLNEIVNALLSLAKARKQEIMPQPVDMTRVMQETVQRMQPLAERMGALLDIPDSLPECLGSASWLEEALVNYVSNALKYGGTPPHVEISTTVEANGMIAYHVQDNGMGLTAEQQAKLFHKFERLGQQKIDGTGIGLMIVKTIVEKLGGQVKVSSSGIPGEGTTFSLILRPVEPLHDLHLLNEQNVGSS